MQQKKFNEVFDYTICGKCSRREENKPDCPYRNMSLLEYCDYKNIPYEFRNAGAEIWIDTSNLMNSSAMIELNNEIHRTRNVVKESGYDYKVVI